tara:strand:+ start:212 stop:556 length:345 start_codon:yes stop_codon:yes gene_type:complete
MFSYSTDKQLMSEIIVLGVLENGMNVYAWQWNEKAKAINANYGASESDGGYAAIGFKAQEIKALYPKAVFINDNGYLQINASILASRDEFIGQKSSGVTSKCARILNTKYSLCF